jgi:hypothetical protein
MAFLYSGQQAVHIGFNLKGAFPFGSVSVNDNQKGKGSENTFSGKTVFAHGNPLEDTADILPWKIKPAVQEAASQVQSPFPDSAGTVLQTFLPVVTKYFFFQGTAKRDR